MKLCGIALTVGAVVVALLAVAFQCLSAERRFDVITRLLYPLARVLWSTGLAKRLMFAYVDDTNFTMPRSLTQDTELMEAIKNWEPGEGFIVATFPKSGTHLMAQMTLQIASNASEETAEFESIHHYIVAVEMVPKAVVEKLGDTKSLYLQNYKELSVVRPFLFFTHLDCEHIPLRPASRYVVVARDPADVLLSMHSQMVKVLGRLVFTKEEGIEVMQMVFGGWAEWNLGWWRHRNDGNVLFLFYEEVIKDRTSAIRAVTRFMGREEDEEVIARVAARTDIKYMKEREASFEPPQMVQLTPVQAPAGTSTGMVSKGKSGRGEKELSDAVRAQIRSYCRQVFGGTDFPLTKFKSC